MRLFVRNQIIELLSTIEEGIHYAQSAEIANTISVLEDCSFALESIRTTLEQNLSASRYTEYKSLLYPLQNKLNEIQTAKSKDNELNELAGQFIYDTNRFKNKLTEEREVKIEVLFLPYKYSMWDSLESVWKAADEDPRCNAYVMPIPYYDRDERGFFSAFHYEGNDFVKNDIPIVSHEEYSISQRQPDMIYIHNPFDGGNSVTSVAPDFYSNALSGNTGQLIYIPYYVSGSAKLEEVYNPLAFQNINKIIVQSETHKKLVENTGIEAEKILALGTPKLDTLFTDQGDILPDEWIEMSKETKKVILLNTGLADLLKDADRWIGEITAIVELMKNRSDAALIWRPHPLTEATLSSMRRQYIQQYTDIKKEVESLNNVLIDETPSAYAAIMVSDALISDYSSILLQYIATEKPVLGLLEKNMLDDDRIYLADYRNCYFTSKGISADDFIQMVCDENDPLKEKRVQSFTESVKNSDGTAGINIHNCMMQEFLSNYESV